MKNGGAFKKVVSSELQSGGQSIFGAGVPLGNVWELTLECGHTVHRQPLYTPLAKGQHKADWFHRRSASDVLAPPKKVKCSQCSE